MVPKPLQCAVLSQPHNQEPLSCDSPEARQRDQDPWWSSLWPTCNSPNHPKVGHHKNLLFHFKTAHSCMAALCLGCFSQAGERVWSRDCHPGAQQLKHSAAAPKVQTASPDLAQRARSFSLLCQQDSDSAMLCLRGALHTQGWQERDSWYKGFPLFIAASALKEFPIGSLGIRISRNNNSKPRFLFLRKCEKAISWAAFPISRGKATFKDQDIIFNYAVD